MALTTVAQLKAARPGQWCAIAKPVMTESTDSIYSVWTVPGNPAAGAAPSSGLAGDVPTFTTLGAIPFVNPTGGAKTYIGGLSMWAHRAGMLWVYDRLWQNSGVNVTITTGQTINSVALTRPDANGVMAELWWQTYALMGAGTPTVTVAYTNSSGTASRSADSGVLATTLPDKRTGPFNLQSGDIGVKSVQTWTANATFTSGTIGLVLRRKIAGIAITANAGFLAMDGIALDLPQVPDSACLELLWQASSSTNLNLFGDIELIQG